MHPVTKRRKDMSTPKIKKANISYRNAEKHAVTGGKAICAKRYNPMCPPSNKTRFVKVNNSRRNTGGGGYAAVLYGAAADEKNLDMNVGSSAYSDFIHYNYGAASERQPK